MSEPARPVLAQPEGGSASGPPPAAPQGEPPRPPPSTLAVRVGILKDVFHVLALVAAGFWGLSTFWYQSHYLPTQQHGLLMAQVNLERLGQQGDRVAVRARVSLLNRGKARQRVWALFLNVMGTRVRAVEAGSQPSPIPEGALKWSHVRGFVEEPPVLLATFSDTMLPPQSAFLDPTEKFDREFVFYLDKSQVDLVRVRGGIMATERDVEGRPEWITQHTDDRSGPELLPSEVCESAADECPPFLVALEGSLSLWP